VSDSHPRPRLIVFDADGTLIDHSRRISPRVKAAVAAAQAAGIHQAVCTGRPLIATAGFVRELRLRGPQITFDGALVSDLETGEVIHRHGPDPLAIAEVLERSRRLGLQFELYTEDAYYAEHDTAESAIHAELIGVWPKLADLEMILATRQVIKGHYIFGSPAEVALARDLALDFAGRLRFSFASPPPGFGPLEFANVVAPGVTKGDALRVLAKYYGVDMAETMGVGDGMNDLPLVQAAGIGVAMGNSAAEVIAAADEVTASVDDDGLALVIERYLPSGVRSR
jgi:5-amino-6-(5-phospho-D-ribitylamino)uracil phosphatase